MAWITFRSSFYRLSDNVRNKSTFTSHQSLNVANHKTLSSRDSIKAFVTCPAPLHYHKITRFHFLLMCRKKWKYMSIHSRVYFDYASLCVCLILRFTSYDKSYLWLLRGWLNVLQITPFFHYYCSLLLTRIILMYTLIQYIFVSDKKQFNNILIFYLQQIVSWIFDV